MPSGVREDMVAAGVLTMVNPEPRRLAVVRSAPLAEQSDDALCRAFLAGNEAAFSTLLARHEQLVYALVRRYAPEPADARDLTQKSFLRAFEAARRTLGRFARADEIPFRAWLARIAINLGKNHSRQHRRWRLAPVEEVAHAEAVSASPTDGIERAQQEQAVRQAVLSLPKRQREVLTLRVDAALPFNEIARTLGITANNAKVHFHHAVKRLKAAIAQSAEDGNGRVLT